MDNKREEEKKESIQIQVYTTTFSAARPKMPRTRRYLDHNGRRHRHKTADHV